MSLSRYDNLSPPEGIGWKGGSLSCGDHSRYGGKAIKHFPEEDSFLFSGVVSALRER